ncbi:MAG: hypothetical protein ACI4S3_07355 [Candidatus Gastranaerophilaceae bacterium]
MQDFIKMIIVFILILFYSLPITAPTIIMMIESKKEQEINKICVEKFKTTEEIKQCKEFLNERCK